MAERSEFSKDAWEILLGSKDFCLAEGAAEIVARHLFQSCASKSPELPGAALVSLGVDATKAAQLINATAALASAPGTTTETRSLASDALDAVAVAKRHAWQRPTAPDRLIAPVHLWAGVCAGAGSFGSWLRERGWTEQQVRDLPVAAERQLPATQGDAGAGITDEEREVMNRLCQRNLTALARTGQLSKASGVERAHRDLVRCLLRREKRNAVLTGRAGVGKTKLVEDLACRIAAGEVPELAGCEVFELDLTALTRGTHLAGSRAERFAKLTQVMRAHPDHLILFIDELHTIVGLPMEGGAMDLSNALKPLLVDARVRIVGATTTEEFARHIEGDPALVRRFSEVKVPEPDRDTMLDLLREIAPRYQAHHHVTYAADALEAIYDLAQRYVPNQAFPSKAVDLMDEAGVHARLAARERPEGAREAEPQVTAAIVSDTLARVRGIAADLPAGDLAAMLSERVIGQEEAAKMLADAVITSTCRFGSRRNKGPRGAVLFLGPPGVGKSYMAEVLSDIMFPGRKTMLTVDMTEFEGPHAAEHARFRLLGAPPPYVGWEKGGLLTAHAQQHPMSVVLVDELDKAGAEARNILLKILNDGWVQDGRGRIVSFEGIFFILTANAARGLWETRSAPIGFGTEDAAGKLGRRVSASAQAVHWALMSEDFSPELMSRVSRVVLFNDLDLATLRRIVIASLSELREAALIEELALLEYDETKLAAWVVARAEPKPDARRVAVAFEHLVEAPLAHWRWQRTGRAQPTVIRLDPGGWRSAWKSFQTRQPSKRSGTRSCRAWRRCSEMRPGRGAGGPPALESSGEFAGRANK